MDCSAVKEAFTHACTCSPTPTPAHACTRTRLQANLGDLSGLEGMQPMVDGGEFDGAKAYKDAKVCNMLTMCQLHKCVCKAGVNKLDVAMQLFIYYTTYASLTSAHNCVQ